MARTAPKVILTSKASLGSLAVVAALLADLPEAEAAPVKARRAYEFIDSVGVATHWGYTDTPYADPRARDMLIASGIRHVRDGWHGTLYELAQHGIRATIVLEPKGSDVPAATVVAELKALDEAGAPRPIVAVTGPNEPELFWPMYHADGYLGQGFPEGPIQFLKDAFAAIRTDASTAHWKVMGIPLGMTLTPEHPDNPLGNAGELAPYVDWGDFHPYPQGNAFNVPTSYGTIDRYYWTSVFPSLPVEGYGDSVKPWIEYYQRPYGERPMAVSETGYSTHTGSVSERIVGKYIPRLYLEFFRKGIQRTFVYEFIDEWDEPADRESNFGMVRHDFSPKPSYTAVKNLLAVLEDVATPFDPGTLDFELEVSPVTVSAASVRPGAADEPVTFDRVEYVRHVVLTKSNGNRYLVLWHDISNSDHATGSAVELTPPAMPATLRLGESFDAARLISFDDDGVIRSESLTLAPAIPLQVPDRPLIVELLGGPPPLGPGGSGGASGGGGGVPTSGGDTGLPAGGGGASGGTAAAPGTGTDAGGSTSGCGCRVSRAASAPCAFFGALALLLIRLRRRS